MLLDDTISVDDTTGEVVSETYHIPAKAKEAVSYRLGNGKYILHCREEIEKVAKGRGLAMPILLDHVLSGEVQVGAVPGARDSEAMDGVVTLKEFPTS